MLIEPIAQTTHKQLHLKWQFPKSQWPNLLGEKLDESSYDELLNESADVFTPEGELLLRLRKKCLPVNHTATAFDILRRIKAKTNNRGIATGKLYQDTGSFKKKKDGTISRSTGVASEYAVNSAIVGYFDRYVRIPFCRQTAFNAEFPDRFEKLLPFFQSVDRAYAEADPGRYELQRKAVNQTHPDFVIRGTSFTTVTVNQNFQTAVHCDKGDLKDGLSTITVLRGGEFQGGNLVFPHYRVAVSLDSCDLLMFDSHHMHGNTPIFGKVGNFQRVSCVLYYREKMIQCGSALQELERAKSRTKGTPLYGE